MTLFPVIVRELRSQSRQPSTYWLRVVAAGAVFAVFAVVLLRLEDQRNAGVALNAFGAQAFGYLNAMILVCTMVLAPLLTADSISRERREGTLGLLFLTKLSAGGIVAAKGFVHTFRGVGLFCAMLPILTVPILIGGVTASDCLMALLIDGTVLLLGLAAGLLASAFSRDWIRSFVAAEILSACFAYAFMLQHAAFLSSLTTVPFGRPSFASEVIWLLSFHANMADERAMFGRSTFTGRWNDIWALGPAIRTQWFAGMYGHLAGAFTLLLLSIGLAAKQVSRSWREEALPRRLLKIHKTFTTPIVAVRALRTRLSRSLDRNPIGWLQHYSWSGRITKWSWFAGIIFVESLLIIDFSDFDEMQPGLAVIFFGGVAFASAASFRKERESGALELLLVCPLTVAQLMLGRLRGLWAQFLPSVLLLGVCIFVGTEMSYGGYEAEDFLLHLTVLSMFVTIPIIGLFLSLHTTNFLPAWLLTMALGLGVPCLAFGREPSLQIIALYIQCGLGLLAWLFLRDNLTERKVIIRA
jgi:ABC-type transport system involved in multi-copper enzyme maturation permease subunit